MGNRIRRAEPDRRRRRRVVAASHAAVALRRPSSRGWCWRNGAVHLSAADRSLEQARRADTVADETPRRRTTGLLTGVPDAGVLGWQFFVGIYGGYFGAGAGIIMLAVLGFIGLTNIHRMNGLKNWGGLCMNAVAAITFALQSV